jgi:hypothetical protein
MMFTGERGASTEKRSAQQAEIRNRVHHGPAPVGQRLAAQTGDLKTEQLDDSFVNAIVMRLDDSRLVLKDEFD